MDKQELNKRAKALYEDELQYAIKRDDEIDIVWCRSRAALRLGREMEGQDVSALWLAMREKGGNPTLIEVKPEWFAGASEAAA